MVNLKCPDCGYEQPVVKNMPVDHLVTCRQCEQRSEFRQWHEAWCASRRDELIRAYPSLEAVLREPGQDADFLPSLRMQRGEASIWP